MILKRVAGAMTIACIITFVPTRIMAQSASQLVPQSYRPANERTSESFTVPSIDGLSPPPGAGRVRLDIHDVDIPDLNSDPEAQELLNNLRKQIVGKPISGIDLFAAANQLEEGLIKSGRILDRVVIPAQTLKKGDNIRISVVRGFIERIDIQKVPEAVRERVGATLAPLENKPGLRLPEIERKILLAGDLPGLNLRSTLSKGKLPGGTILTLEGGLRPIAGSLGLDNSLSQPSGHLNAGIGLDINGVGGIGEQTYVRLYGYPGDQNSVFSNNPRNRSVAAGIVLPLGHDGWTINPEITHAQSLTKSSSAPMQTEFLRGAIRLRYAMLRARHLTWNLESSLDAASDRQDTGSSPSIAISRDQTRVARLSSELIWTLSGGGQANGKVTASFGLNGLGARSRSEAASLLPLSRQGADDRFNKLEGLLRDVHPLTDQIILEASARWQYSFNTPLLKSEQIGIASPTGLSAFDAGALTGDSGWLTRGELSYLLPVSIIKNHRLALSPYIFASRGTVYLYQPSAVEHAQTSASSFGLGLRTTTTIPGTQISSTLSLEYGRQQRSDGQPIENRLNVSMSSQF